MKDFFEITDVLSRKVFNLEGAETIEAEVTLDDGTCGRACVSAKMVDGKDPSIAAQNVNTEIAEAVVGLNALDQTYIDSLLLEIDGEDGKRLGTNATLAVSFAVAKAAAESSGLALYNYLGGVNARNIPEIVGETDTKRGMKWYPTLTRLMDDIGNYEILCGGNTEDTIMANIAVAVNAKKMVARPNVRNELIRIEEELYG